MNPPGPDRGVFWSLLLVLALCMVGAAALLLIPGAVR